MFHGCFKHVLKKLQGYSRIASKVLERTCQKCSKEVTRLFQGNFNNVSKVFQNSIKGVSREFCFLILLDTHRSYPSRRRACLEMRLKGERNVFSGWKSHF